MLMNIKKDGKGKVFVPFLRRHIKAAVDDFVNEILRS